MALAGTEAKAAERRASRGWRVALLLWPLCARGPFRLRGGVLLRARAALVPALRGQGRLHVLLRDEEQAGVGVGRGDQTSGQLVEEELDHRVEALQVGLLIDCEVQEPLLDQLQRRRQQVVAPAWDLRTVLLDDLADALGVARVD